MFFVVFSVAEKEKKEEKIFPKLKIKRKFLNHQCRVPDVLCCFNSLLPETEKKRGKYFKNEKFKEILESYM